MQQHLMRGDSASNHTQASAHKTFQLQLRQKAANRAAFALAVDTELQPCTSGVPRWRALQIYVELSD